MQPIIYDVAVSIDGYISGPGGDISKFAHEGPVVDDYFERMRHYAVAIMGRHTYEFGYRFGLEPGANPYKHMRTYVFSKGLKLPEGSDVTVVDAIDCTELQSLRRSASGPIYLCGGGSFAGTLLSAGLIDRVRLKRAPILLGGGTCLFDGATKPPAFAILQTRSYDNGYVFQEYEVKR
ncbi:dihydrofolate reductase family protein [Roseibium sediminicola]|uniref:Dihydrofolate reductase family protein n=1 Tax=Roseibium sediminicola TaxID=2933272 RepID=A0ABT0H2I2_9HYPH|nr:dihydrofolate reductase family protein [Roseibium sp. CAU 1639]MCK7615892.1 dihydrofolate reductase family protein [Roseibium sp. CAU 1639]